MKYIGIGALLMLASSTTMLNAQASEKPLVVGIFIYQGVEILDFSGPSEVFQSTNGFNAITVAISKEPIVSQGFVTVTPQYSIDDCPVTDILVFPGGSSGPLVDNAKLIAWIKNRSESNQFMMSVCTGAAFLSAAGLLDGKEATTWYGFIPRLQQMTPACKVLSDTRFVDNGQVVTTAGVSAGIDGALHVVSRVKGESVAQATAKYMEYDKWEPNEGKVITSAFITSVRENGIETSIEKYQDVTPGVQPLFYQGEMMNMAYEMLDKNPKESAALFEWLLKTYPSSASLYDGLGKAWSRQGKESPIDSKTFLSRLESGEVDWARKTYADILKKYPGWALFTEDEINMIGYHSMNDKRIKDAIAILQWNTELYAGSPNAWDSLAEVYEASGDYTDALAASEMCLSKLPAPSGNQGHNGLVEKAAKDRIERMKARQ